MLFAKFVPFGTSFRSKELFGYPCCHFFSSLRFVHSAVLFVASTYFVSLFRKCKLL